MDWARVGEVSGVEGQGEGVFTGLVFGSVFEAPSNNTDWMRSFFSCFLDLPSSSFPLSLARSAQTSLCLGQSVFWHRSSQ